MARRLYVYARTVLYYGNPINLIPSRNNDSPLLRLPAEVMSLIGAEVPLSTRVILAQTCRSLRSFFDEDWHEALRRLSRSQRMAFYAELAYALPDYLACLDCRALHRVRSRDIPSRRRYTRRDCEYARGCRYVCHRDYALTHNHVQLALKYTRLHPNNGGHGYYLKRLMRPCHLFNYTSLVWIFYAGVPKIVAGRFLYSSTVTYAHRRGGRITLQNSRLDSFKPSMYLCKHTSATDKLLRHVSQAASQWNSSRRSALEEMVAQGTTFRSQCTLCRADFAVNIHRDQWILRSWQDFGTEEETGTLARGVGMDRDGWDEERIAHLRQPVLVRAPRTIEDMYRSV